MQLVKITNKQFKKFVTLSSNTVCVIHALKTETNSQQSNLTWEGKITLVATSKPKHKHTLDEKLRKMVPSFATFPKEDTEPLGVNERETFVKDWKNT